LIDEKENKIIPAQLLHRAKDIASCVGKQMGNINYNTVDDFKDLHGFTVEIDSQEKDDMVFVLQKYYFLLLEKAKKKAIDCENMIPEIDIENKEMFCVDEIKHLKDQLDPDFYNFLLSNLYISEIKNSKKRAHK
jgi:hypothetical protein